MVCIAPGEAALHAAMAAVRLALFPRHHAHQLIAAHLRLERAAHAAIGAGRDHRPLRHADLVDGLLLQGRGRAGLHTGAAADAIRVQEILRPGRDAGVEAAPVHGQREGALHLFAGAHAAHADDAFRGIIEEIRIGIVARDIERIGPLRRTRLDMVLARRIAHVAQANGPRHVLQFAIAIGRAGQTVQRVIGDIELHHPAPQPRQLIGLGLHDHAFAHGGRAGRRRAAHPFDLDHTQAARAVSIQHIGRTQLRHGDPGLGGGAHHGGALGHAHIHAVDHQSHRRARFFRRAHIGEFRPVHSVRDDEILHSAASCESENSCGKSRIAERTG